MIARSHYAVTECHGMAVTRSDEDHHKTNISPYREGMFNIESVKKLKEFKFIEECQTGLRHHKFA